MTLRAAWRVKAGTITQAEMMESDRRVRERGARRYIGLRVDEHREWDELAPICQHLADRWRQTALDVFGTDIAAAVDDALNAVDGVVCCDDEPARCSLTYDEPLRF